MLSRGVRMWAGTVQPEWKVTVAGAASKTGTPLGLDLSDDGDLVQACLAGSQDAFDGLVQRHRRAIYQLCYGFVGNRMLHKRGHLSLDDRLRRRLPRLAFAAIIMGATLFAIDPLVQPHRLHLGLCQGEVVGLELDDLLLVGRHRPLGLHGDQD